MHGPLHGMLARFTSLIRSPPARSLARCCCRPCGGTDRTARRSTSHGGTPGRRGSALAFAALNPRGRMPRPTTATRCARTAGGTGAPGRRAHFRSGTRKPSWRRLLHAHARCGGVQIRCRGRRWMQTTRWHRSSTSRCRLPHGGFHRNLIRVRSLACKNQLLAGLLKD